ncbi:PDZ domain-containing protein [Lysobacter sp. A6]|uniref:PDZ domain-containing protein n=1 Tax=Noviluteimonas lactosilytica TaxID=2888523 RepID=A0ABS8JKB1_9GAMM|nr:PDZ domain-containing protein [Lysobacter lactosilyticus]MCC8364034.1 PDZ domain-containing protein [Lysobacter lactosilyticus]
MKTTRSTALLGACIALALAGTAAAQTPAPKVKVSVKPDAAEQAQLETARKDMERAAKRYAELQVKYGEEVRDVHVFQRHMANKPVIGVVLAPDAQGGVRVAGVTPDSGAAKAGLKPGDRITAVGGTQVLGNSGDLRLANARKLFAGLGEGKPVRIDYVRAGKTASTNVTPKLEQNVFWVGAPGEGGPGIRRIQVPGVDDGLRQEIVRIQGPCRGKDCKVPMMAEAFRWSGLNLASVDAKLGRYFGTDRGVLVISAGKELEGLQAGDVIQKIDGKTVGTPREAMDALRAKDANQMALVEYLRDKRTASTRVKVPEAGVFMVPPPPPAPPAPPSLPRMKAPPAPPAPPPAPAAAFIDDDGKVTTFKDARIAYAYTAGNGAEIELVETLPPAEGSYSWTTEDGADVIRNVRIETIEKVDAK